MNLKDTIEKDFIDSYKAHDEMKVSVFRMLKSAIKNAEISAHGELQEEEMIKVLRHEVKQREEAAIEYDKGGRSELALKEKQEATLIDAYLPKMLSKEEIKKIVDAVIMETGATDMSSMGKVIGLAMKQVAGLADGGVVSTIVRDSLNS